MKDLLLPYSLGGLLYTPALNSEIGEKILSKRIPCLRSITLCLEDSVSDDALEMAEKELCRTMDILSECNDLPLIFIRVRTPQHLNRIRILLGKREQLLCGFVLPKFDLSNAEEYMNCLGEINRNRVKPLYFMPILESGMVASIIHRRENLVQIKSIIDTQKERILNVRVGGNDFCNLFGIRRHEDQTIYEIGVIRDVLSDIINVFGHDYVVSGPVWEYFGSDANEKWADGLKKEIEEDKLNGFIGKTAIHPAQLPVIEQSLRVRRSDYEDAKRILDWRGESLAVHKSTIGTRMNEVKCHTRWAEKTVILGDIYGISEEEE